MQRDQVTLLDIARAARLAAEFVADMDREVFLADTKTLSAVLHQLLVMGEAVKRLSDEFRAAHAETPWGLIAGMRDKLIHAYDEVDLDQVWVTVQRDVPALLRQIEPVLPPPE